MSQIEDDDSKPYTEHDLSEAIRRINAGEINLKEAESYYGINPRTIHRQRAIENMRAQLNPEKAKKLKAAAASTAKKDITILRKPVEISCSSINDVVSMLSEGTEELKQLLNYECDLIYECKVCKSLFRSLVNFISHKRIYCCDMFSVVHSQSDENGDELAETCSTKVEEKFKTKENLKEFTSRPFRITCRKDLTTVLKRITSLSSDFVLADPLLHLQNIENTEYALQQAVKLKHKTPVSEPTTEPSESNKADENVPVVSKVELKKEITPKSQETTSQQSLEKTATVKPLTVVPDKRFKCPLCPKHFTIKKSVLRHLKSIHHKSEEQLEKLKSRIQPVPLKRRSFFGVLRPAAASKKLTATCSSPTLVKPSSTIPIPSFNDGTTSPTSGTKNDQNSEKGDWEKDCSLCGRHFVNRSAYYSHKRTCRKNALNDDNADSAVATDDGSVSPIISLTPVNVPARTLNSPTKRMTSAISQKKMTLPLGSLSTTSSSKKIGIQVRMNYFKEGLNQSGTTNGSPSGHSVPSSLPHTSSDCGQNSVTSVDKDKKLDVPKADLPSSHNTRSTAKLAHIVKSLHDKHGTKDENEDPSNKTRVVREKKNNVSIYCEDCKTAYTLNDQRWGTENGIPRSFKCALQDCDFRSSNRNELLPHLSAQHAIPSENSLGELKSNFIAESAGSGKHCCHKQMDTERPSENQKRDATGKSRILSGVNPSLTKRKSSAESNTRSVKRKVLLQLKKDTVPSVSMKLEDKTAAAINPNDGDQKVVPKKMKEDNRRTRTKKPVIVDDAALRNVIVPNGLQKSINEPRPFVSSKTLKKQNQLVAAKLPKINSFVDSTLFPLTSDTNLDPSTMTEENLKKSVMTIIFGKDMPDENMDTNIVDTREKSPDSSSTSSDNGREKRYGLRAGKPIVSVVNKAVMSSLSENKDDKVLKIQIVNKVKSASR